MGERNNSLVNTHSRLKFHACLHKEEGNGHYEAHRIFRFHGFLHCGREATAMKKRIGYSGSIHFCMGERNNSLVNTHSRLKFHACLHEEEGNGHCEAHRISRFHGFLHCGREAKAMKKRIGDSG